MKSNYIILYPNLANSCQIPRIRKNISLQKRCNAWLGSAGPVHRYHREHIETQVIAQLYLVGLIPTPLKKKVTWDGWLYSQYMEKNMFQTTNQVWFHVQIWIACFFHIRYISGISNNKGMLKPKLLWWWLRVEAPTHGTRVPPSGTVRAWLRT